VKEYDVVVVGGGVAGSVAAKFAAKHGYSTLLLEKYKTPRNKPCSGIQFTYFEKLLGAKIPSEKLCSNELWKAEMVTPKGKVLRGKMKMLNFWRSTFDSWLNSLAVEAGSEFLDETSFTDLNKVDKEYVITVATKTNKYQIKTRYLIGTDGMLSRLRNKLQPEEFVFKAFGTAINYYFKGETNLDPNTLYMFYKREFCPLMFAWAYLKDDLWVIGTGANQNPMEYIKRFYTYIEEKYSLKGKIVKKEGFASTQKIEIYLGEGNILLAGDAAGLIDLYRGVGMDTAALSGRLAIKAIRKAEKTNQSAISHYKKYMKKTVLKLEINAKKQTKRYSSNSSLENSLSNFNLLKNGISMMLANQINKILPPEKLILLPV
jgi:digeranylgeranylglycerophospholipid reductase